MRRLLACQLWPEVWWLLTWLRMAARHPSPADYEARLDATRSAALALLWRRLAWARTPWRKGVTW